jgi:hypothetical protein
MPGTGPLRRSSVPARKKAIVGKSFVEPDRRQRPSRVVSEAERLCEKSALDDERLSIVPPRRTSILEPTQHFVLGFYHWLPPGHSSNLPVLPHFYRRRSPPSLTS